MGNKFCRADGIHPVNRLTPNHARQERMSTSVRNGTRLSLQTLAVGACPSDTSRGKKQTLGIPSEGRSENAIDGRPPDSSSAHDVDIETEQPQAPAIGGVQAKETLLVGEEVFPFQGVAD